MLQIQHLNFEVTNLTAEEAKATNGDKDLKPPFKNAPAGAVKPGTIELAPAAKDLTETSISKKLTFTLVADNFYSGKVSELTVIK